MHLIISSDDATLLSHIREYAQRYHAVLETIDSLQTLVQEKEDALDVSLIILGHNFIHDNDIVTVHEVREKTSAPIMFVGGMQQGAHVMRMLDFGIDECIPDGYSKHELFARIQALLRRGPRPLFNGSTIIADAIRIDTVQKQVFVGAEKVSVSPVEYRILEHLCRHYKYVVDKRVLEQSAIHTSGVPHLLNTHIANLRKKLGKQARIVTVPRRGFMLDAVAKVAH